jgi:hypothetical protein
VKTVLYTTDDEAEALAEEERQIEDHVKRGIKLVNWRIGNELLPPMYRKQTSPLIPQIPQMTQAHKEMLERATAARTKAAAGEQSVDVQEPSPMRRHLIELAAKRDLRAWTKFLPIFGDWLGERGDPEEMVCRATWRRVQKSRRERRPMHCHWIVEIPPWCAGWAGCAAKVARRSPLRAMLEALDRSINERWLLHFPPGRVLVHVPLAHYIRLGGTRPRLIRPSPLFRFFEALQEPWTNYNAARDHQVIEHGMVALFWPPPIEAREAASAMS